MQATKNTAAVFTSDVGIGAEDDFAGFLGITYFQCTDLYTIWLLESEPGGYQSKFVAHLQRKQQKYRLIAHITV